MLCCAQAADALSASPAAAARVVNLIIGFTPSDNRQ
jgi:hypothetical protein